MEIPKTLKNDIWDYCRINDISNIDEFTIGLIIKGFTATKFGSTPMMGEKIVEKIVEVPIEKIVEVQIATIDTELTEAQKNCFENLKLVEVELKKSVDLSDILKKQIEELKHRKDIYGE